MLDFSTDDLRLLTRINQPLTLDELDRLTALAQQNGLPPSALAFEAQRLYASICGDTEPPQQLGQTPSVDLQRMTQSELWQLSEQQAEQRRKELEKETKKAPK